MELMNMKNSLSNAEGLKELKDKINQTTILNNEQLETFQETHKAFKQEFKAFIEPYKTSKKDLYVPYKEASNILKELDDRFKMIEGIIKEKISDYLIIKENERLALEEAKRIELAKELKLEEPLSEHINVAPEEKLKTGGLRKHTSYSVQVLDITKVPVKYLLVDEVAIKKDFKESNEQIPGIHINAIDKFV